MQWLAVLLLGLLVGEVLGESCTLGDATVTPTPDFKDALDDSYTAVFEVTDRILNKTYHVHETRQRRDGTDWTVDVTAVHIRSDSSVQTLYYYDQQHSFVFYSDGVCSQSSERFPFDPWGWWDEDPEHGSTHYGPTTILRLASYLSSVMATNVSEVRNDILCDAWKACSGEDIEIHYFYSAADVEMPDMPYFGKESSAFPVHYSTRKMDDTMHMEYNILEFVPFVMDHRYLETPRGADCENVTSLLHDLAVPNMPEHYSFHQEAVDNAMIDGEQSGTQTLDYSKVYYSADLSLIRMDFIPYSADETIFQNQDDVKFILDYNTGVQYLIDKKTGNCSRTWLVGPSGSHHHGFFGASGEMVGPDEFLHLNYDYAYLGPADDRHMEDHRWTITRHNVYDPVSVTTIKKLVVEWEFLLEVPDEATKYAYGRSAPVRSNLFTYSNDDPDKVTKMVTSNIYDYSMVGVYTPEEFNVYECAEERDFDISYIVLFFLTNEKQHQAVLDVPNEVVHHVFRQVMTYGQVSPVRIADIDISDGIAEPNTGNNETDSNFMLVSVRLLERAPYIYSYSKDDETSAMPGVNEKKIKGISNIEECAEFCSRNYDFDCLSFQVCDDSDCYLSKTVDHDGDPVSGVTTCEHWVLELDNITFTDLPSEDAFIAIRDAVFRNEFSLVLHASEGEEVTLNATNAFHYNNPDPMEVVSRQFSLNKRLYRLSKPRNAFDGVSTLLECESLCLNLQEYTCESLSYTWTTGDCRTASAHADEMSDSEFETFSHSAVLTKAYLTEYVPIPGRISLNTTGVIHHDVHSVEACARLCSIETSIACRSFDLCLTGDCQLHEEAYLGPGTEGSYTPQSQCTHFSKASKSNFEKHSNQGLASDQHRLVLSDTTTSTCAQLCLDDSEEVCESYDFCEMCQDADDKVCGSEGHGLVNVCFVSSKHLGEDSVSLLAAPNCQHYEREYFGDMTYAEWKNSLVRANDDPYGPGDMAGLAVGMIILGVLLAAGFLYVMAHPCQSKTPSLNVSFASLRSKMSQ